MSDKQKDFLAQALHEAWKKYRNVFEEDPHGTYRQLRALVEFVEFVHIELDAKEPVRTEC
jgi:hypothetical protein